MPGERFQRVGQKPIVTLDRFEVVRVPFPFIDRQAHENRPVRVLSHVRFKLFTLDRRLVRSGLARLV